jgi:hypothetical protein
LRAIHPVCYKTLSLGSDIVPARSCQIAADLDD